MMRAESTEGQQTVSQWQKVVNLSAFVVGLLCLTTSAALILIVFVFLFRPCSMRTNCHRSWGKICGGTAVFLFLVGIFAVLFLHKRSRRKMPFLQRAVSEIPAEDVEKTPRQIIGIQPFTHNPQRYHVYSTFSQNSDELTNVSQSIDSLPDYFSAVRCSPEVEAAQSDETTTTPPPSYQEAIRMAAIGSSALDSSAVGDRNFEPDITEDT